MREKVKYDVQLEIAIIQLVKQYGIEEIIETVNRNYNHQDHKKIKIKSKDS